MTEERRQITGHILACGTQIMWGATFVSTKVLLNYFLPAEVLFTRAVLAFLALLIFYPHHLKLKNPRQELAFAGAGLFGIVLYFMLENTALTMTYASNVGIIVACAPFFVAAMVGIFFKNEKSGLYFYIGFVIAIAGVILISMNGQKSFNLNPLGDGLAFLAMISWGAYSALVKKIGEWDYPDYRSDKKNLFLWNYFPDPCVDSAESILGSGSDPQSSGRGKFPFPGTGGKCTWLPAMEPGNQMDWRCENQRVHLCITGGDSRAVRVCSP